MTYVMWLLLGLGWFDGTHTASVWAVYREQLHRLNAGAAERRAVLPPSLRQVPMIPPRPLPPAPPKR
jgi:hypothetical protein